MGDLASGSQSMEVFKSIFFVASGAALGALFRFGLGHLNHFYTQFSLDTLLANLLGGFVAGVVLILLTLWPQSAPWRLFLVVGFYGSLTTFSAFSTEMILLIEAGHLGLALFVMSLHLFGTLLSTFFGLMIARQLVN